MNKFLLLCSTLSFPLLANEFSPIVSLEALYLTPREDGLAFATTNHEVHSTEHSTIGDGGPGKRAKIHHVDFDWDFGFRLGIGGEIPSMDEWRLMLAWTWFRQTDTQSVHQTDERIILVPWGTPRSFLSYAKEAKSRFKLRYDTLDFDLGRTFCPTHTVQLIPYMGVRAAWIQQNFDIKYDGLSINVRDLPICNGKIRMDNDFKGVGLRAGLGSKWFFAEHWNVYGDLSAALIYGTFKIEDKEGFDDFNSENYDKNFGFNPFIGPVQHIEDHFHSTAVNIDFLAGFAWDYPFWSGSLLTINLGYEFHLWLNQNQFEKFSSGVGGYTLQQDGGDLSLSGVALGVRCKF